VRIRRVFGDYRAAVEQADVVCFPGEDPIEWKEADWWVVETDDGEVAGYAGIKYLGYGLWYLCRCGVLPDWRGNGLQKRLIRAREKFARARTARGDELVITDTSADNPPSANSLISCGYRLYEPAHPWRSDALFWRKDLL